MKTIRALALPSLIASIFAAVGLAYAKSAPEMQFTATDKNLAALKAMPIKVLLPTYVPADYVIFNYELEDEGKSVAAGHPNYSVMYLKDKDHWFEVESADTVGDTDWEDSKILNAKSKAFGEFTVDSSSTVSPEDVVKTSKVISSWLPCLNAPKDPEKWPKACRFYHIYGRGLTADEVVKIVNSLVPRN